MVKFIQLTDTHLVKPDEMLFGIDGWDRLEKAVASKSPFTIRHF